MIKKSKKQEHAIAQFAVALAKSEDCTQLTSVLTRFQCLCFVDLKKHTVFYWFMYLVSVPDALLCF